MSDNGEGAWLAPDDSDMEEQQPNGHSQQYPATSRDSDSDSDSDRDREEANGLFGVRLLTSVIGLPRSCHCSNPSWLLWRC